MKDRRSKQVCKLVFCAVLSVFGIYFSFFDKKQDEEVKEEKMTVQELKGEEKKVKFSDDYTNNDLPDIENESNDSYTEGKSLEVYFTNTQELDASTLPLSVQEELGYKAQEYLYSNGYEGITELAIDEGFIDNENEVEFTCQIPGQKEKLHISYDKKEKMLKFAILIIDKIEEGAE